MLFRSGLIALSDPNSTCDFVGIYAATGICSYSAIISPDNGGQSFLSTHFRLDYRNLEEQLSDGKIANVSLPEIKTAIEQLSFEERAELAAWLHGWNDDEWDEKMKRDIGSGKLDDVLHEVEEDIRSGRTREMP